MNILFGLIPKLEASDWFSQTQFFPKLHRLFLWEGYFLARKDTCQNLLGPSSLQTNCFSFIDSFSQFPSEQEKIRNNSFLWTQFDLNYLTCLYWEGIYLCKQKILSEMIINVRNDSFHQPQFGPRAFETISQRRFLLK